MNKYAPFSENQIDYLRRCKTSWFNVAEGGKRGGKNVINTLAWCMELETHPDKLHLAAAVSIGNAKINIIDCDGYGVLNYFCDRCREGVYKNKDAVFIQTIVGEKVIILAGGGSSGTEKNIKGNTYGTVYITEANECNEKFIQECFDRTISSHRRKIFHDLNPKSESNKYYTLLNFHKQLQLKNPMYGYNYGHFTIADNYSISNEQLKQVIETYDKTSIWYKRDILGERASVDGLVYCFTDDCIIANSDLTKCGRYYICGDYGIFNPMAWNLVGIKGEEVYIIDEYHHSGRESGNEVFSDIDYLKEFKKWYSMLIDKYDIDIDSSIFDPSASSFIILLKQNGFYVKKANNTVIGRNETEGIQLVSNCIQKGHLHVCSNCTETIREFRLYMWDSKKEFDCVVKENDHHMDAIRYLFNTVIKKAAKTNYGIVGA